MIFDTRVPLALGASLLLHGAALALADRMPVGWRQPATASGEWGAGALHARLIGRAEEPQSSPAAAAPGRGARGSAELRAAVPALPGFVAAPIYVPAEQLDERPQIRTHVEPAFPLDANAPAGRVVLRLLIAESGIVDRAEVLDADPPGPFGVAAVEAFAPARFSPGRKHGVAVKSALTLELRFGEAPRAGTALRQQHVPLFQAPRRAPARRVASAQERP